MSDNITVKVIPVNPLGMNMYVVSNAAKDAVVIDPGCASKEECEGLFKYTKEEGLNVKHILLTHPHFDHVMGAKWVCEHYNLKLTVHETAANNLSACSQSATAFGFTVEDVPEEAISIKEGDIIKFGASKLEVLYTPGHCEGSVCFVCKESKNVFTGDVLFRDSIGRTDLKDGDYDLLIHNIKTKVFPLGDDYTARPGHGGRTTIGYEMSNNPFIV